MNTFTIVFGTPEQFTLQAAQAVGERFAADHVQQLPIFTRAHLAQVVGELEDQRIDSQRTVLFVTDQSLCLKSLICMQSTFPELIGAYHVENLGVNIIAREVSVGYAVTLDKPTGRVMTAELKSVIDRATGRLFDSAKESPFVRRFDHRLIGCTLHTLNRFEVTL